MLSVRQKSDMHCGDEILAWQYGESEDNRYIKTLLDSGSLIKLENEKPMRYILDMNDGYQDILPTDWLLILDFVELPCGVFDMDCVVVKDGYFKEKYEILDEVKV